MSRFLRVLPLLLVSSFCMAQAQSTASSWKAVEEQLGRSGSAQPGDVYKFSFPRSDLHVQIEGVEIKPALALGGWLAFKQMGDSAMVMGDLVLTEDEVAPVMAKLQAGGIEQTALHNHVLHESPRVMYMHVSGHGSPEKLARAASPWLWPDTLLCGSQPASPSSLKKNAN